MNRQYKYSMSKFTVLLLKLAVLMITAVFWGANYCVRCAVGGPSTGRASKCSGFVDPRKCLSKQLQKRLNLRTVADEMLKLTNLYAVTTHGRYHCLNVVVGLV